ncbi:forkhead box protein N4 isoform X3 [Manacus candei]|uniref:forkhead box protein N4 isoform X3 n=1 Tax=Manacus candei TaxID=415023 RepID=UPI002227CB82|nr:forkhead box protein N4 isoform X3 [Manacus candei]
MIESDIPAIMSGIIRNSGQNHHSSQEYRLLASDPSQLSEDELPGDLQSLSWLTSVDVPRLQQMASGRMDFSLGAQNAMLQQPGKGAGNPGVPRLVCLSQQMSPYAVSGQLSPGLQTQQQLFSPPPPPPPHSQQVFALAQNTQQCNPAGIYNTSYGTQPHYSQPRLAPHSAQELHPKHYPKPIYSYSCLIAMALKNSKTGSLPVSEIYSFMKEHFPYFKTAPDGWKNSVRHNLSLNKCFEKVENKLSGTSRKGCLWALNPAKIDKMEEEMQKWKRKDLAAIHRSMANPEELDKLITDRPESCRRPSKQAEPEVPPLSHMATAQGRIPVSQLQPQPIMTLSLQSLPLHHQLQTQARLAPNSPAPAQTPPLHTLPDMSHSPLPHHPLGRAPPEFPNVPADMSTEVDALDPSIMDFALQGNIWEEMKDESFSLDTLGAFSTSPLHLSDCDLGTPGLTPVSSSSDRSFPDLQVTGLYTTYTTLDNVAAAQYMTPQGNKPIPLL